MQCDDFLPMVEKLADGECSTAEKEQVRAHLEACDACREHYEFLKALPDAARRTSLPEPPGAYWEALPRKVMVRIDQEQSTEKHSAWLPGWFAPAQLRWLAVVAAGLMALVLSYEVMLVQPAQSPEAEQASSTAVVSEDKDRPSAFEVSDEAAVKRLEQDGQGARELELQEADDLKPMSSARKKARPEMPSPPEKTLAKTDEQTFGRARPVESPISVPEKGETEGSVAAFADEEASVLHEVVGKEGVLPPTEPSVVVADAPERPQAVSGEESKLSAQAEPSPDRGRAKLEADQARALDRIAVVDRSQKASYRGALGAAQEPTESQIEARSDQLRDSLEGGLEGDELLNARFELAECSIALANLRLTEERRNRAVQDSEAFLKISPEGEKAEKIKRGLAALLEKK